MLDVIEILQSNDTNKMLHSSAAYIQNLNTICVLSH